jgi:hypothetical protein
MISMKKPQFIYVHFVNCKTMKRTSKKTLALTKAILTVKCARPLQHKMVKTSTTSQFEMTASFREKINWF